MNNQFPIVTRERDMMRENLQRIKMTASSCKNEPNKLYATNARIATRRGGRMEPIVLMLSFMMLNLIIETQAITTTISPHLTQTPTTTAIAPNQSIGPKASIRQDYEPATNSYLQSSNTQNINPEQQQQQKSNTTSPQQQVLTPEQVTANASNDSLLPQISQLTKAVPVLRPSIEEVASKLSRKHLNLEHENWRLKAATGSTSQVDQFQSTQVADGGGDGEGISLTTPAVDVRHVGLTVEAEQEIKVSSSSQAAANSSVSQQQVESSPAFRKSTDHYLHIDAASGGGIHPASWWSSSSSKNKHTLATNSRRKKGGTVFQQSYYEDNELYQCHQYLKRHSSPPQTLASGVSSTSPIFNAGLSRLVSSQLLPCSCESRPRQHDSEPSSAMESTWLSCDNVQLMGSHFYIPPPPPPPPPPSQSPTTTTTTNDFSARNFSANEEDGYKIMLVTKFSQRDSGLQTLHAQKFHYLQLFHLKSIDLSDNRIRLIKMDAFHGLEHKLEYLNLANNLLGDSRALSNEKLIFASDELNRLRNLKWLSLHNNQINQLGPTIFYKPSSATTAGQTHSTTDSNSQDPNSINENHLQFGTSELSYLDLSENLLNFIPSESIHQLNELKTLKLSRNRISQLDQFSKFPKSLNYLDLSENSIRTIRQCNLIDLPNLIELNLSHNQLSHLDNMAFISSSSNSILANNLVMAPDSSSTFDNEPSGHMDDVSGRHLSSNIEPPAEPTGALDSEGYGSQHGQLSRFIRNVATTFDSSHADELENTFGSGELESDDDMDAGESIISSMAQQVNGRQTMSDEANTIQHQEQFNSTLKLNLSYNLFDNVPGDSLLKFTNLQQLDLSFNRIRKLDSNYFCSIYNLVENLRSLDLSGNLLSITGHVGGNNNNNNNTNSKHLNKLFGCLLRLEKLLLSTNRLAASMRTGGSIQTVGGSADPFPVASLQDQDYGDQLLGSESNINEQFVPLEADDRLTIKFGDGFGSRYLNTLDLSDNQLTMVPIIEQVVTNPIVSLNLSVSSNLSDHQSNLNQWINSRLYLEAMNLNYNSIERLDEQDFEHLFNLRHLYLDFNKLSSLPVKLMRRFTSLDRLSLNGNLISSLSPLNELFERSTRTLRLLNLANNRLTEWPQIITTKSIYLPEQLQKSSSANVYDDLQQQQAIGFALEELNLEGNQFTSDNITSLFDQLLYMKSLRVLNLKFNLLNRVKSEWFKFANKNLQTLLLSGNKINNIDLGSFAWDQVNELIKLHLDHNLLRELKRKTFDSLPKLTELNLANNLIHTINSETFHQVNSLQILRLNNNKLTSWKCEYFSNLCNPTSGAINADLASLLGTGSTMNQQQHQAINNQQNPILSPVSSLIELDLSHNSLSQLRANSIAVHTKLLKLNLSHNKLSFIPHDLFKATTSGLMTGRQISLVSSIKYLNLAHNHIQTIDNINFRPLKNLLSLDLSHNELQTLGVDVILLDARSLQQEQNKRRVIVSNNLPASSDADEMYFSSSNKTERQPRSSKFMPPAANWPSLSKLRHLNVANNQLTVVNQSLIGELSPFALLNLNLSFNYLDSESLPHGFYSKITTSRPNGGHNTNQETNKQQTTNYDLVFTLKLESLDLSHNKLNEFPTNLLDNHYTSMESCNLSHNRIQNLVANSNLMLQIKSLNLEYNPLSRESNELVLFEQRSVRYINLAATRLYAIHQATITTDQLSSQSNGANSQLKYRLVNSTSQLDLIRSISKPINAPYLRHLNLSSNQLVWLAANVFDKMHSLQTLDLSNNQLTRLHLLNNQLMHVSSSLEYLNMASNLFTSIDSNDFSQLSNIRHLDLNNLLSLQKMNCKFLSKLGSLRTLRMFNYPQLRQNINNLLITITSGDITQDRMQKKLINELVMSSIGRHCFQDDIIYSGYDNMESIQHPPKTRWFDLEQLELELFNNFWSTQQNKQQLPGGGGGFRLRDELTQLLGPRLKVLTLFGLNLTSLSDDSLFGITSEQLKLKISYTSMSLLPLRQLLNSLGKRTELNLDFRNNNIQSIDTRSLQLLDELQLNNQILRRGDHSSLKLSSNPIRCDCQTRPLWLWLNQRWARPIEPAVATGDAADVLMGDMSPATTSSSSALHNYWPKFKSITYTSDLKCYYPPKLRGKPTQHVNYNDLVCKGATQPVLTQSIRQSSSRKTRNETRSSDSYYITSPSSSSVVNGGGDLNELDDSINEDDYLDFAESTRPEIAVRLTKFNKYPASYESNSSQLWSSVPLAQERPSAEDSPSLTGRDSAGDDDGGVSGGAGWSRKDRGRGLLEPQASGSPIEYSDSVFDSNQQKVNTNYNKHRPNIHQRHSHYDTLSPLNSGTRTQHLKAGAGLMGSQSYTRHSVLTDIDVLILTVASIAMIFMSFIIIIICLYKYKLDQSGKEQILEQQSKFLVAQAGMLMNKRNGPNMEPCGLLHIPPPPPQSSNASSRTSSKKSSKQSEPKHKTRPTGAMNLAEQSAIHQKHTQNSHSKPQTQVLLPMGAHPAVIPPPPPATAVVTTNNFLMRSPTIRRMHGIATNASDWFKFTLRAYPPASASSGGANRRRHLLIGKNVPTRSQLTTAQLVASSHFDKNSKLLPAALAAGCPIHAFRSVHRLKETIRFNNGGSQAVDEQCHHCRRLVAAVKRAKVNYVVGGAHDELTSSSNTSSTAQETTNKSIGERRTELVNKSNMNTELDDVSDENGDHHLVPRMMIRPPADQKQQQIINNNHQDSDTNRLHQSTHPAVNANHRRELQRTRPLRTFGNSNAPVASIKMMANYSNQMMKNEDDQATSGIQSQIPTVDIEGRFAYQSDSNYDSPACNVNSMHDSRPDTRTTDHRSSSLVGDQEEMFILVHDSSNPDSIIGDGGRISNNRRGSNDDDSPSTTINTRPTCRNLHTRHQNANGEHSTSDNLIDEFNSMMNDECSHSSSPVAYGFMRSSPSATTLSSVTTPQTNHNASSQTNHANNNNSLNGFYDLNDTNSVIYNNNNNNTGYWVPARKEKNRRETQPITTTSTNDDQIIISRL